ncbi:MAG: hypothetical protein JOZ34_06795 [Gammaproteobacteria bacterium]|nr:hypothetical protein [Gammaproteobacteria bacterium]
MSIATRLSNKARWPGDPTVVSTGPTSLTSADRAARALGWFSIGLGLSELLLARRYARTLGVEGSEWLIRGFGAREIGAGMLTLSPSKAAGLWSRVGGDVLDIGMLGAAAGSPRANRGRVAVAAAFVLGVTVVDVLAARAVSAQHRRGRGGLRDYRDRSGFPQGLEQARGAARDFRTPRDYQAAPSAAGISPPTLEPAGNGAGRASASPT